MNNALTIKKHQRTLNVQPDLPCFLQTSTEQDFPFRTASIVTQSCSEFLCISDAVFLCLKQNLMHMHCSFTSAIRKLQIALTCNAIEPFCEAVQRVMAAELYMLTWNIAILWQLVYYLLFSVVNGTFGNILIHLCTIQAHTHKITFTATTTENYS